MIFAKLKSAFLSALSFGVLFVSTTHAQSIEVAKANEHFEAAFYKEAIPLYEIALEKQPNTPEWMFRLAESYRLTNDPVKAEYWYGQLIRHAKYKNCVFEYAQALKTNRKYAEAKYYFLEYKAFDSLAATHFAASCDYAKNNSELRNPMYDVVEMKGVNSRSSDFAPTFYQGTPIFASARSVAVEKNGEVTWTSDAFNQYYTFQQVTTDSFLVKPVRSFIGRDINDAPISYTSRGTQVAITSNNFMDGIRHIAGSGMMMDIYLYEAKSMREWDHQTEKFFPFNAQVDAGEPFSTGHPCFSSGGDALYFSSDRPGGFGGYDIYVCFKTGSGWSQPKNLGYPVNTPGNELTPNLDQYGRLYFSSDWHWGFGGMDVFTAERLPFGWGNVQNLGWGVNSSFDDMYFSFDSRQQTGYLTSNRIGGTGNEDIYRVQQKQPFPSRKALLANVGDKILLKDVFYKSGQIVVDDVQTEELYNALLLLHDNPEYLVQVNCFTDSRGSETSNARLSQQRAKGLVEFFSTKSLAAKNFSYAGYGESFLLNACTDNSGCSEEQHRQNRRIELFFVGSLDSAANVVLHFDARPGFYLPLNPPRTYPMSAWQLYGADVIAQRLNSKSTSSSSSRHTSSQTTTTTTTSSSSSKNPTRQSHYAIGDVIEVANIYYEHGKATIDESNSPGLKQLIDVLKEHPHVVIEIGSHTDATGSTEYNAELSQKRAEAVKRYLEDKGIAANRLTAKGYGETKILNRCKEGVDCSEEENKVNRRTEFKVTAQMGFKVGDIIKVDNIYYESDESRLDMKRSKGLKEIIQILKDNNISVEIRSHTDSKGSSTYNSELSEKRAKAVYDYLVSNGVSKYRLKYKGYGETLLLNHCKDGVRCSDEEHQVNRRTDFKVIGLK